MISKLRALFKAISEDIRYGALPTMQVGVGRVQAGYLGEKILSGCVKYPLNDLQNFVARETTAEAIEKREKVRLLSESASIDDSGLDARTVAFQKRFYDAVDDDVAFVKDLLVKHSNGENVPGIANN